MIPGSMMVSGKVKGQHVLLWSVCVVCLLPALGNACTKVEFPTAKDGVITVLENQNVAIPFSLNSDQTCQSVIITVSKMNKTNNIFMNFCKLRGIQPVRKEMCKTEPGHLNYSVTKLIDRSDETSWRWRVTHDGDNSDTTVRLRVILPVSRKPTQTTTVVAPEDTTQPTTRETPHHPCHSHTIPVTATPSLSQPHHPSSTYITTSKTCEMTLHPGTKLRDM
ncbi:hypothetical protein ACOMHN_000647 [Nucella lapillus]